MQTVRLQDGPGHLPPVYGSLVTPAGARRGGTRRGCSAQQLPVSSMKVRVSSRLDPVRVHRWSCCEVSRVLVLLEHGLLCGPCPQLPGTHQMVFVKIENSDRIYNMEFKIWGVKKENLTL